jgi:predicted amidophosphoribosyltransferase
LRIPCPSCGKPARQGFGFCPHCGRQLGRACPECHRAVEPEWSHCARCGAGLARA